MAVIALCGAAALTSRREPKPGVRWHIYCRTCGEFVRVAIVVPYAAN